MKTYLECLPCFVTQALEVVLMTTEDNSERFRLMRLVFEQASRYPEEASPPEVAARMHRMIRDETETDDPYKEIKRRSNEFALQLLPKLEQMVEDSDDQFESALRLAIAGNVMDWGAKTHTDVSEDAIKKTLHEALDSPIEGSSPDAMRKAIKRADHILYLADNAGEIVFDRLFLSHMPEAHITVAVKGGPAINDATITDAEQINLHDIVDVIDSGSDAPGTVLDDCSEEFRTLFDRADLIVSKGQGNYETLSEVPQNIFYLLKVKCPVVARDAGYPAGSMLLLHRPAQGVGSSPAGGSIQDATV